MRLLALVFFLIGFLLLCFGVGALGAAFTLRGATDLPDGFAWKPPLAVVDTNTLAPATLLLSLAGSDALQALSASLERGHWDNALAIIAYDPNLSDTARVGVLLQLGERFAARRRNAQAAWCYEFSARVATISPTLGDSARIDALLQSAAGLRTLNARDAARLAVDQAYLLAQFSPGLRRDARAQRLSQIADAYAALGANDLAAQARRQEPADAITTAARQPFAPTLAALPVSADLDRTVQSRLAAAQALASDLEDQPRVDWSANSAVALADALRQEDDARRAYHDRQIAQSQDVAVLAALWRARVNWLALKYRIARGGFGANAVPEWEKDATAIGADLSDACAELFLLSEAQANALPNERERAREDVLRQAVLAIRWGWYADAAERDVRASLDEVNQTLREASAPGLRLDRLVRGNIARDLLVPDDLYGQGEKALPR